MDNHQNGRMLSLFEFYVEKSEEQKPIVYYLVFKLKPNNQRAIAFVEDYLKTKYDFNLEQGKKIGEIFRFKYFNGQFLDEVKRFSFNTINSILQKLLRAIYQLHTNKQLARCISIHNIFLDQAEEKIYLLEYGFEPEIQDSKANILKPTQDAKLIIEIMQYLSARIMNQDNKDFLNLQLGIEQISVLIKQLSTKNQAYDQFKSIYFKLYMLATNKPNQPTQNEIEQLYTDQWFQDMKVYIDERDYTNLIRDPDWDSYEKLLYLKEVTNQLKNLHPQYLEIQKKQTQIGLMLALQRLLIKDVKNQNLVDLDHEIKKEADHIILQIDPTFSSLISYQNININELMPIYKSHTVETFKAISENQQSLQKLRFMLITTLLIDKNDFKYQQYREQIQQENIKDNIKRVREEITSTSKTRR